jgi:rhodanese-related sulfurtransferase
MIELTRTKNITIAIIALFVLLIIGLLTMAYPKYYYKSDPSKMIEVVHKDSFKIFPNSLAVELLKKNKNLVLVDIRSQFEFYKGNIEGSVNMPANNILEDKYFDQLKDFQKQNKIIVFYGNDIVEANVPFMTIYPLGIENVKLLLGGYDFFKGKTLNDIANSKDVFDDEKSLNDINKYISEESKRTSGNVKTVSNTPAAAPKKVVAPAKHEAAAEEEGC